MKTSLRKQSEMSVADRHIFFLTDLAVKNQISTNSKTKQIMTLNQMLRKLAVAWFLPPRMAKQH